MRDILDKLAQVQFLPESKGMTNRTPGDIFRGTNGQGDISFVKAEIYPPEGGKVDPADLDGLIATAEADGQIIWVNPDSKKSSGAFIVANFEKEDNHTEGPGIIRFGRFVKEVYGNLYQNQQWKNVIPGYEFSGKSSKKVKSGVMPQDILTKMDDLSPDDVVAAIALKFGDDHPFVTLASELASGASLPISIPAITDVPFSAFRDYFCELLHPIALIRGTTVGAAHEAEELYLPDEGYASCSISFSNAKTEGLSDSILISPSGKSIKVSSKGGKGSAASVKNLANAISVMRSHGGKAQAKILTKHSESIDLIQTIATRPAKYAPVDIAVDLGIINNQERIAVFQLEDLEKQGVVNYATAINHPSMTSRLKKLYLSKESKKEGKALAFFHMVTAIAFAVAKKINTSTDFSSAACDLLNNEAMVQVDTRASNTPAHTWTLESFTVKFPGNAATGVILDSEKHYSSTAIKGKFGFKILYNNAKAEEVFEPADPAEPPVSITDPEPIRDPGERSGKKAADTTQAVSTDSSILGREKR